MSSKMSTLNPCAKEFVPSDKTVINPFSDKEIDDLVAYVEKCGFDIEDEFDSEFLDDMFDFLVDQTQ